MTGEDSEHGDYASESVLSRRELLGASAALGTAAIASATSGVGSVAGQTSTEPRIALGADYNVYDDPNGNGDLMIKHEPSGNTFIYDESMGEWAAGTLKASSFSSGETDITDETLVLAGLSANQSISKNTMTTLQLDSTSKDERAEHDTTTYQFTPDQSGFYLVSIGANFSVGSSGDNLLVEFQDVTAGNPLLRDQSDAPTTDYTQRTATKMVELTGGNNHEVLVRNQDSSDTILSGDFRSYLTVRSMFR